MNRDDATQAVAEATAEVIGRHVPEGEWSDDVHLTHAADAVETAIKRLNQVGWGDPEGIPELWAHVVAMATVVMLTER